MAFEDYDVREAFARIEDELISSMIRNLGRHLKEEADEGFDWSQWQVEQLKYLEEYRRKNKKKFGPQFASINRKMQEAIQEAAENGQKDEELRILHALTENKKIRRRYANQRAASIEAQGDAFFRINDRKLEALLTATQSDMVKAEQAVLRRANDQYRKIIFDAQVYANTGAGTVEKAVDMATKDFLSRGIDSIQYKNGSRHTISDYADMYIRTAERRAYLMGEGNKRQEWGMSLVLVNKRGSMRDGNYGTACPQCIPWLGKVLIDDVYSGGKPDGKHKLLSDAMAAGFLHPRCKDGFTTYFPGISSTPDPDATKKELKEAAEAEKEEVKENYVDRQAEKYERLAENSLDAENQRKYEARRKEWHERQIGRKEETEKALLAGINQDGTDSLLDAYERRREYYGLNLVPADQLRGNSLNNVKVDYTGVSVETAEAFNTTISGLSEEYLSGITRVRVADPKEVFGASFFAQTQHNDTIGQNVLVINPYKCSDAEKMIERIRELSDRGYCVKIPEGMEAQYVATHEFAHGLLDMQETRKSLIGMDWKSTNKARREIKVMYQEYMDEIRSIEAEITELRKQPALTDFSASAEEQMEAFRKIKEAQDRLSSVRISEYSMENADEFMAEAFTQHRIGVGQSEYSDRVMEVLDREYRLDARKEKPLARIRKKLLRNGRAGENSMVRLFFNDSNYYTVPQAEWFPDAKPGSHEVKNIDRVFFNGEYHDIDNVKIQFKTKPKERKVAELLSKKVGGPIYLRPIINQPEGIHSADIEFNGIEYDIKTLEPGPGKNKIYNRVKKKPGQSTRYIVDITNTDLSDEEVNSQISKVFWSQETLFVKELVIIRGDNILRIAKRL
jgi:hypothetical protein